MIGVVIDARNLTCGVDDETAMFDTGIALILSDTAALDKAEIVTPDQVCLPAYLRPPLTPRHRKFSGHSFMNDWGEIVVA